MKLKLLPAVALIALGFCTVPIAAVHAQDAGRPMLRVSSGAADNATFDPHRATSTHDKGVVSQMFNGLVRFPPGSADPTKLEPDLAESWDISDDRKVWTFHLRKGVQFHGEYGEMKAEDVVYSLERAADPKRSSFASTFVGMEKVEALDDYTVRVTLKYPDLSIHGGYSHARDIGGEHNALLEAALARDVDRACSLLDEHLTRTVELALLALNKRGDL